MQSVSARTRPFDTLLVANRGEIALRVMKSARRLGLRTVAVFSEADRGSPHTEYADRAYCLGGAAPSASYLAIERVIAAARATGAQAIHPGYGFLAENADFADAVEAAGLVFVGPPAAAVRLMGNKAAAKERMQAAGVPCVPGYQGKDQSDAAFARAAANIGFPVMIKSAAGGGGRGMRLVDAAAEFADALRSARSEAQAAFGSPELILERAIGEPRHIEVQVFADAHANVIHLGERDCSVQRRHQKLIEESPSPAVSPALREQMGAAAIAATRSVAYLGAGTIEFLLAPDGAFYFMEMNTRLQVEHGVTELVTGLDLVEWQLRVAAGESLPLTQQQIRTSGHAMEVRLCAEDATQAFLPQTGEVLLWEPCDHVRTDAALAQGLAISPYYDSMAAKLMSHGASRAECVAKLAAACERSVLLGVRHNLAFLRACLLHPQFEAGHASTAFIGTYFPPEQRLQAPPPEAVLAGAAIIFGRAAQARAWTNAHGLGSMVELGAPAASAAATRLLRVSTQPDGAIEIAPLGPHGDTPPLLATHPAQSDSTLAFELNAVRHRLRYACASDGGLWLHYEGEQYVLHDLLHARRAGAEAGAAAGGAMRAPLAGRLLRLEAKVGDSVTKGQTLAVLDSMKMEHALDAPVAGTIAEVHCAVGEQVMSGRLLLRIAPAASEHLKEPA